MSKSIIRILVFLLVPCLLQESVAASWLTSRFICSAALSRQVSSCLFNHEALAPRPEAEGGPMHGIVSRFIASPSAVPVLRVEKPEGAAVSGGMRWIQSIADIQWWLATAMERRRSVDVMELLQEYLSYEDVREVIQQHRIEVKTAFPKSPSDRTVIGSPHFLRDWGFESIIANAILAMDAGGLLNVQVDGLGEEVCIRIMDTGQGIHPEDLTHVWDLFASGWHKGYGGLGLTLAKETIQAHGGRIALESEVGKGTQVTIWLPIAPASEKQRATSAEWTRRKLLGGIVVALFGQRAARADITFESDLSLLRDNPNMQGLLSPESVQEIEIEEEIMLRRSFEILVEYIRRDKSAPQSLRDLFSNRNNQIHLYKGNVLAFKNRKLHDARLNQQWGGDVIVHGYSKEQPPLSDIYILLDRQIFDSQAHVIAVVGHLLAGVVAEDDQRKWDNFPLEERERAFYSGSIQFLSWVVKYPWPRDSGMTPDVIRQIREVYLPEERRNRDLWGGLAWPEHLSWWDSGILVPFIAAGGWLWRRRASRLLDEKFQQALPGAVGRARDILLGRSPDPKAQRSVISNLAASVNPRAALDILKRARRHLHKSLVEEWRTAILQLNNKIIATNAENRRAA